MPADDTLNTGGGAADVAATFCATLVDEWIVSGVRHAVIAPGSRSTPLALALTARVELELHVFHDERSASFAALGIGLATGLPAVLLCSSGTAAAHFHAAVIEAHQSGVPMLVCTADRPPELRDVGAPQTIDQIKLYGGAVRWFTDPGVADADRAHTWRSTAAHAFASATGAWPGPVHLNLAFREPLIGRTGVLPVRRTPLAASSPVHMGIDSTAVAGLAEIIAGRRGIVVAGRGCGDPDAVAALAVALGWPVLADARSGLRTGRSMRGAVIVTAFDDIVRSRAFIASNTPEVVIQLGEAAASKVLGRWSADIDATRLHVSRLPTWTDPDGVIDVHIVAEPTLLCRSLAEQTVGQADERWATAWATAERSAQRAYDDVLMADGAALTEPTVARVLGGWLPPGSNLMVSSSMPIRDIEWYASVLGEADVHANRGANGIDGVIATGIGVALASAAPTFVLIGDVAFLHDSTSLVALASRAADLRIVLVDNDGGGIFSFLPQATTLPSDRFEQLFGTPHGVDLEALLGAHSMPVDRATTPVELTEALRAPGPRVVLVRSDRAANVAVHERLHAAVAEALG